MSAITAFSYYLGNIQMTLNVIFMFIINSLFCLFIFKRGLRKVILKGKGIKKIVNILFLYVLVVIVGAILNYILLTSYIIHVDSIYTAIILLITMIGIHLIAKVFKGKKLKILN
ncbi:hypothetical protein Q6375_13275 [Clostridium septicum]|uniref:hypothetical protein n=1 Tax=Clostridium septicum TaxID=1504 RepID=UPI00272E6CF4|nr:hypothetical protein [Clostridium septicum]WLF68937.1 hypothetical protein Q6375_13275 [Clostridium septicum]